MFLVVKGWRGNVSYRFPSAKPFYWKPSPQRTGSLFIRRPSDIQSWRLGLRHVLLEKISWLSQSWHARRLSAANVPLTACHVSPYWRSEVEWNESFGLCGGQKAAARVEVWLVGKSCPGAWDMQSSYFHTCKGFSLLKLCLSRENGANGSDSGVVFLILYF